MAWFDSLFGSGKASVGTSPIDVITYLASLVSRQQEIDPILDVLRQVTARITPGESLSREDQALLAGVYDKLIQYLVGKEALRKFTKSELTERVKERFSPDEASGIFWQKVTAQGV
jgi:hypothetical protein